MESGDRILVAAGLTAAVVVGAFVLWGPGGAPRVRKRRGQIAGLQNLGKTCFLNTLIQALAACPVFIEWLKKYATAESPMAPFVPNSMITTLYTVIEVVNGTHPSARGTPVCPLGVVRGLRAAGWVLPPDQHDAHELLHVLLTCLDEELAARTRKPGCLSDALGLAGGRAWSALASPASPPSLRASPPPAPLLARPARPASAAPPGGSDEPQLADEPESPAPEPVRLQRVSRSLCQLACARRWLPPAAPRAAPAPPYRGTLAARLQCTACGHKTPVRYDKFDSVSLSMSNASLSVNGTYTLAGLLRAFTAPELVSGVTCSQCAGAAGGAGGGVGGAGGGPGGAAHTQHIRTVSFGKLPACLWLHVSRVQWCGGGAVKRSEHVAFPETLHMAPYAAPQPAALQPELGGLGTGRAGAARLVPGPAPAPDPSRARFRLAAAVLHVGGPRSGHFATYRRGNGFEANRWWYTSDTLVHEVSLQEVLRCAAYMLFYERLPH